jgi:hypothetical protein
VGSGVAQRSANGLDRAELSILPDRSPRRPTTCAFNAFHDRTDGVSLQPLFGYDVLGTLTTGAGYIKAGATTGVGHMWAGATTGAGYMMAGATAGAGYIKAGATAGAGYIKAGATAGAGYIKAGATAGAGYMMAGATAGVGYTKAGAGHVVSGGKTAWNYVTAGHPAPPATARGRLYYYYEGATLHLRDDSRNHWYRNHHNSWTSVHPDAQSQHGRGTLYPRHVRSLTHRFKNLVSAQGSIAWVRAPFLTIKRKTGAVSHTYHPKRAYIANIENAAFLELGAPAGAANWTATTYARHFGGHSQVNYNWCHLLSFGIAADDAVDNLVAATTHCNSEQMAIEHALYEFKNKGLTISVTAVCARGTRHLGESIHYRIWYGNYFVYSRFLDCRRATEPTFTEMADVRRSVRRAILKAFSRGTLRRYVQGLSIDLIDPGALGATPAWMHRVENTWHYDG